VAVLDNKLLEAIRSDQGFQIEADAMVTNMQGVCPVVLTADCVPVLFYDPVGKVAGVAHAGWRGTLKHIVSVTVKAMAVHFGSRPGDILAGIGPSIGPCCYEVREEVLEATEKAYGSRDGFIRRNSGGRWHFDLWYANRFELVSAGIQPGNIGEMGKCTKCNDHTFFSSRASGGNTGRSGAGIWLD
jgi:YfiH family protein